jgi:3-dehydroshikimate dehydratase
MNMQRILLMAALAGVTTPAGADTLVVNRTDDDGGKHTLRWAILESNIAPGRHRIEIHPTGNPHGEWVIRPTSLLPQIVGPAVIEGMRRGNGDAPDVVIDGSNIVDVSTTASCPAENGVGNGPNVRSLQKPALSVVDSGNVDISGLEIRNFCIGVMLLRSRDDRIHHNVIHDMVGAAGVMITGDAGDAAGSSTTGLSINNIVEYNDIYDTGDGGECTRGSANITYRFNRFSQTSPNTVSPRSQGVECAGNGNDNIQFIGNTFSGYSDGLQLNSATNVLVEHNTISASTYGITTSGTGIIRDNVITGNRMGIGPANAARITITRNAIYDNGQPILSLSTSAGGTTNPTSPALLGIDVGVNGVTPNDLAASCTDGFPDCNTIQNFPVLDAGSSWQPSGTVTLVGTLSSRPNATFTIDFYASHRVNAAGLAEGEVYLGSQLVASNATGNAAFSFVVPTTNPLRDDSTRAIFTATATNANGATSEFSAGLSLAR